MYCKLCVVCVTWVFFVAVFLSVACVICCHGDDVCIFVVCFLLCYEVFAVWFSVFLCLLVCDTLCVLCVDVIDL